MVEKEGQKEETENKLGLGERSWFEGILSNFILIRSFF